MRDKSDRPSSRPGTWIAIPLPRGGYAIGLVVRRKENKERRKKILVYLFGPHLESLAGLPDLGNLACRQRVAQGLTSDYAIQTGRWAVIGRIEPFDAEDWPPPLMRIGPFGLGPNGGHLYEVYCMGGDLEPYDLQGKFYLDSPDDYVPDGIAGHIAFEQFAEQVLRGRHPDDEPVSNQDYVVTDEEWEKFNRFMRRRPSTNKSE